jgi:hypothetical protein
MWTLATLVDMVLEVSRLLLSKKIRMKIPGNDWKGRRKHFFFITINNIIGFLKNTEKYKKIMNSKQLFEIHGTQSQHIEEKLYVIITKK